MSTVAFRDGVMDGDTRAYTGHTTPIGTKTKIDRLADGSLIGVSSTIPGGGESVRAWWEQGRPDGFTLPANFTLLVVNVQGQVFYAKDTVHVSGPLEGDFFSIGSGSDFAIGAMEYGATAVEAIRVAAKHDVWSGVPIDALSLDGRGWRVAR